MKIAILDYGYVTLIEKQTWGSDEGIIEAARMSTGGTFRGWDTEARLLEYLWTHRHYSPFEQAGLTFEVQAPIFVLREWHRHRTQSYNEMSSRYTVLPDLYYIPSVERVMAGKQNEKNKQGSTSGYTEREAAYLRGWIATATANSRSMYESLLSLGLARELARVLLPVNQYSRMRASANLRNWLQFLSLRLDEHAQWEIRQYAEAIATIVKERFPRTYELFERGGMQRDLSLR